MFGLDKEVRNKNNILTNIGQVLPLVIVTYFYLA